MDCKNCEILKRIKHDCDDAIREERGHICRAKQRIEGIAHRIDAHNKKLNQRK